MKKKMILVIFFAAGNNEKKNIYNEKKKKSVQKFGNLLLPNLYCEGEIVLQDLGCIVT